MKSRGSQAALTVIFVIFGFMLATQFRARLRFPATIGYSGQKSWLSYYRLQRKREIVSRMRLPASETRLLR
jgi:hypothetical protein